MNSVKKQNVQCVFLILHYQAYKVTEKAIESLLKLNGIQKCRILVYDNGSPDSYGYQHMSKRYQGSSVVHVYRGDQPAGFSAGNNKAYQIAKQWHPDYLIAMNNDVQIRQKDFLEKLCQIAAGNNYYLIGPDVWCPTLHVHQSPIGLFIPSLEATDKQNADLMVQLSNLDESAEKLEKQWRNQRIKRLMPSFLLNMRRHSAVSDSPYGGSSMDWYQKEHHNPVLMGAFLIFTRKFLENSDVLFEPDTGFYMEENLLSLKCRTKGWKTLYTPKLQVVHYHSISTRKSFKSARAYEKKYLERMMHAYQIYHDTYMHNPWI